MNIPSNIPQSVQAAMGNVAHTVRDAAQTVFKIPSSAQAKQEQTAKSNVDQSAKHSILESAKSVLRTSAGVAGVTLGAVVTVALLPIALPAAPILAGLGFAAGRLAGQLPGVNKEKAGHYGLMAGLSIGTLGGAFLALGGISLLSKSSAKADIKEKSGTTQKPIDKAMDDAIKMYTKAKYGGDIKSKKTPSEMLKILSDKRQELQAMGQSSKFFSPSDRQELNDNLDKFREAIKTLENLGVKLDTPESEIETETETDTESETIESEDEVMSSEGTEVEPEIKSQESVKTPAAAQKTEKFEMREVENKPEINYILQEPEKTSDDLTLQKATFVTRTKRPIPSKNEKLSKEIGIIKKTLNDSLDTKSKLEAEVKNGSDVFKEINQMLLDVEDQKIKDLNTKIQNLESQLKPEVKDKTQKLKDQLEFTRGKFNEVQKEITKLNDLAEKIGQKHKLKDDEWGREMRDLEIEYRLQIQRDRALELKKTEQRLLSEINRLEK